MMTNETLKNRKIRNHIRYNGGTKTICVSTCLSFFGISPDTYNYTSSKSNREAYENVIRKNGYGVRSRASEFKVKKCVTTMSQLLTNIKKSDYTSNDFFIVYGVQAKKAHLMVVNGKGEMVIDTAPKCRWRVNSVKQIIK